LSEQRQLTLKEISKRIELMKTPAVKINSPEIPSEETDLDLSKLNV